jgi:di/tricarboxylate transporter
MTDQPNQTPEREPEPEPYAPEPYASEAEVTTEQPTDQLAAGASTATGASVSKRNRPLFGTIFWGVVLLAFAAFMVVWTLQPGSPDPTLWLLGGVIVVGLLLVVAGIAAASRRAG